MIMTHEIKINKVQHSRINEVDLNNVQFGKVFSDHMVRVDYRDGAWQQPEILPYGNIQFSPAMSSIHYGQAIFEGMKAYKDADGNARLFRPLDNWKRFNISANRMCMPEIPEDIFMDTLKALVEVDKNWIPTKDGSSLYIRPFMFATDDFIGVRPSSNYSFMIFSCPVNAYYPEPLKVQVEEHYVRATEGGTGFAKCAGNYGGAMLPTKLVQDSGYNQIVWMDSREHKYFEETGTTNFFAVIGDKVITPPVGVTVLDGITRRSVITLLEDWGYTVEQRRIAIDEVLDAYKAGTLKEIFGTGTAATIAKISHLKYRDVEYPMPAITDDSLSTKIVHAMSDIKTGKAEDKFGWVMKLNN